VKDLSREIMQNYLQQVGSDPAKPARTLPLLKLGRQVGVIGGAEEARFPLNVGLMMFNPQPHRFFPVMQIDVVWFPKEGPGGATNCVPGAPRSKLRISVTGGRPSANAAPPAKPDEAHNGAGSRHPWRPNPDAPGERSNPG